ncbi:uncharacterized protein MONOS_11643 [Monocercomonoides exilis]|uniref:uncharacterized protein n=1 Tax=Monocercomonoides exilis TaxID=2049356 RepID=UPI00355A2D4D|nr:hypothetical protein MONOS_11643 [Monocercomonoides exilis]|eukprot:MONOS_11643.1-p1 / transcript=MONOS_11643.1 / gene=MONOS_11643 / organism=Monocercomonoides_exilis_PA203 / gene_product=unspecified product / transcript_product=unspecified product / location=Mono_scaffold00596:24373-25111(-) / protein_length=231 / sequence_SO=supercontig / SO=protein_coding / is_pseudo=false
MRRKEEEKAEWDKQLVCSSSSYSSSAPTIDSSYASVVEALYTLEASMDDIQRQLQIVVSDTAVVFAQSMLLSLRMLRGYAVLMQVVLHVDMLCDVQLPTLAASVGKMPEGKRFFSSAYANIFPSINDLFDPSLLQSAIARLVLRSPQSRLAVVKLDDEVKVRCVAVNEVGEIVEEKVEGGGAEDGGCCSVSRSDCAGWAGGAKTWKGRRTIQQQTQRNVRAFLQRKVLLK